MGLIEGDHLGVEQFFAQPGRSRFARIAPSLMAVLVGPVGQLATARHRSVATRPADGVEEDGGHQWTVPAVGKAGRVEGSEDLGSAGILLSIAVGAASLEQSDLFRLHPEIPSGRWIEAR